MNLLPKNSHEAVRKALLSLSSEELSSLYAYLDHPYSWYCDRPDCDGEPHGRWKHCEHTRPEEHLPECRHARSKQRPPDGEWFVCVIMTGRGWGKTLAASHWLRDRTLANPWSDWAVVAPTTRLLWRNCVDGPSGLLKVFRQEEILAVNRSSSFILLRNGSRIYLESAEIPDRLRGTNLWGAWCDEVGSWRGEATWDEGLVPSVRLGPKPQILVTTTPKPTKLLKELSKRDDGSAIVVRGSTFENAANLSKGGLAELRHRYGGTRLGRQELEGELIEEVEGALFSIRQLDELRVEKVPDDLTRIVIGVDPSGSAEGDSTGIVVVGRDRRGHVYVLDDKSGQLAPHAWGRIIEDLSDKWKAGKVIAEGNYGGEMVRETLKAGGVTLPIQIVHASMGKVPRGEPVAALAGDPTAPETWAGKQFHIVGSLPELEDEITTWTPELKYSPGRLDALVWAVNGLGVLAADPVAAWLGYAEKRLAAQKA